MPVLLAYLECFGNIRRSIQKLKVQAIAFPRHLGFQGGVQMRFTGSPVAQTRLKQSAVSLKGESPTGHHTPVGGRGVSPNFLSKELHHENHIGPRG